MNWPVTRSSFRTLSRRKLQRATPKTAAKLDEKLGLTPCLSENGYGKRTDVDSYRLQTRGGKGVISMKTAPQIGKVSAINVVDDTTELMLISQFGRIIRIDTKTIRSAGRSTSGVKLLNLDPDDRIAAAVVIPPKNPKPTGMMEPCCSSTYSGESLSWKETFLFRSRLFNVVPTAGMTFRALPQLINNFLRQATVPAESDAKPNLPIRKASRSESNCIARQKSV